MVMRKYTGSTPLVAQMPVLQLVNTKILILTSFICLKILPIVKESRKIQ